MNSKAKTIMYLIVFLTVLTCTNHRVNAYYTFGIPLNLGPTVNSSAHDDTPSVTADELELYFMSYRDRG